MAEGTNGRTWTPVLSILALVTGVAAVVSPMGFGILNIDHNVEKHDARITDNQKGIAEIRAELAAMRVQFAEVETQFKGAKEQVASVDGRIDARLGALDKTLQQEIKNVADIGEILRSNQKENIAAVQDLKVRTAVMEDRLKMEPRMP